VRLNRMLSKEELQYAAMCPSKNCSECGMGRDKIYLTSVDCILSLAKTAMELLEQVEHNKVLHPEFEWLKTENKKLLEDVETTQNENDLLKENLKVQKVVMDEYRLDIERLEKENKQILEEVANLPAFCKYFGICEMDRVDLSVINCPKICPKYKNAKC
jgi:hypothetical protein